MRLKVIKYILQLQLGEEEKETLIKLFMRNTERKVVIKINEDF